MPIPATPTTIRRWNQLLRLAYTASRASHYPTVYLQRVNLGVPLSISPSGIGGVELELEDMEAP